MPPKSDIPQELERFINGLEMEESPGRWGFTVYSTYPPSASEAFDQSICERFQAYIESNLRFTVDEP
jgi:hypothetical protein